MQNTQGMARTLKEHVEIHAGVSVEPKMPLVAWLVEYAGTLYNLYHKGDDGLTPYHRNRGRPWKIPLPPFGESVEFMTRTRHKLQGRWRVGVFLGVRQETSEKVVGDAHGVYVVQPMRRKPEGDRYSKELLGHF